MALQIYSTRHPQFESPGSGKGHHETQTERARLLQLRRGKTLIIGRGNRGIVLNEIVFIESRFVALAVCRAVYKRHHIISSPASRSWPGLAPPAWLEVLFWSLGKHTSLSYERSIIGPGECVIYSVIYSIVSSLISMVRIYIMRTTVSMLCTEEKVA